MSYRLRGTSGEKKQREGGEQQPPSHKKSQRQSAQFNLLLSGSSFLLASECHV